jgi:hypothetical protein
MPVGGTLAFTTIIIAVSVGIIIRHRRGDGWRRIVAVAVLVWLGVAGLIVLWTLIAAVAGQRAYFGAIQVPLAARKDSAGVGITLGVAVVLQNTKRRGASTPALAASLPGAGQGDQRGFAS